MAGYLYNGVSMPGLPNREETYSCAAMAICEYTSGLREAFLLYADAPIKFYFDYQRYLSRGHALKTEGSGIGYVYKEGYSDPDGWYDYDVADGTLLYGSPEMITGVFWANHDLYSGDDNSLIVAASDPIPVPTIDPNALLQGYLVGRAVASQRK